MQSADSPRPALPAVVSVLSADLLAAKPATATVLGVHGPALYLAVSGRVLPVVTTDAVPLPTALRLAVRSGQVRWGLAAGDTVPVGEGRVVLPEADLVVARTWRPARVRRVQQATVIPGVAARTAALLGGECARGGPGHHLRTHREVLLELEGASGSGTGLDPAWLADGIRPLLSAVVCPTGRPGSHLGTRLDAGVAELLGRGPGLTPAGDDALAGALLVAHALGRATTLAAAVRARLHTTTAVSAALLDAAADGYATADVVALVDAALASDDSTVAAVLPRVLALGHTSGHDTVAGIRAAIEALQTRHECARGYQGDHVRTHGEKQTNGRSAA